MFGQNPQQFAQQANPQHELAHILGAVIEATLPVILGAQRGQMAGGGAQGYGPFTAPGIQGQYGQGQYGQGQYGQGQYGQGQHGGQADLGAILGPVLQATLPIILGSMRGQQTGAQGAAPFTAPGMQGQHGQGQYGGQTDLGAILGPVLQATLPIVLGAQRGQHAQGNHAGWGQSGWGQMGAPAFQGQSPFAQQGFGQQGQADLGNLVNSVVQATLPAILASFQGQAPQFGQSAWRG